MLSVTFRSLSKRSRTWTVDFSGESTHREVLRYAEQMNARSVFVQGEPAEAGERK